MSVDTNNLLMSSKSKKVLAHDVVTIRAARGGEDIPMIVSIPKPIANILKLKLKDRMQIYTDGEKIYLDKIKEPELP
jgi:hypothetical protein